ncbi:hypothetical protein STCU_04506, partial [Strigomonas culicis]
MKNYELIFPGGIVADVKPLTSFARPEKKLSRLPVVELVAPTSYDIDTALRHMEADAKSDARGNVPPTFIVVEPPSYPTELVFLKGIPYLHNLSERLQFQKRRGNAAAPLPSEGQSYTEKSLDLLRESLGDHVQDLDATMREFLASPTESPHRHLVLLPPLQKNYIESFDLLDSTFRDAMRPYLTSPTAQQTDSLDAADLSYSEPPSVLFISFN